MNWPTLALMVGFEDLVYQEQPTSKHPQVDAVKDWMNKNPAHFYSQASIAARHANVILRSQGKPEQRYHFLITPTHSLKKGVFNDPHQPPNLLDNETKHHVPIVVDEHKNIIDGNHRYAHAETKGHTHLLVMKAAGDLPPYESPIDRTSYSNLHKHMTGKEAVFGNPVGKIWTFNRRSR